MTGLVLYGKCIPPPEYNTNRLLFALIVVLTLSEHLFHAV